MINRKSKKNRRVCAFIASFLSICMLASLTVLSFASVFADEAASGAAITQQTPSDAASQSENRGDNVVAGTSGSSSANTSGSSSANTSASTEGSGLSDDTANAALNGASTAPGSAGAGTSGSTSGSTAQAPTEADISSNPDKAAASDTGALTEKEKLENEGKAVPPPMGNYGSAASADSESPTSDINPSSAKSKDKSGSQIGTQADDVTVYDPTNIYVKESGGDDETGDGSSANPYKTLTKALEEASTTLPADINLMDDITITSLTSLSGSQKITLKKAGGTASAELIRGAAYKSYLITVPQNAQLTIDGIDINGHKAAVDAQYALINVSGTLTLASGKIYDNKNVSTNANYGGGIYLNGNNAHLIVEKGTVTGNTALVGSGIYYGAGKLTVKDTPHIGTSADDNGIYIDSSSLKLTIDGSLAGGSRVNIENKNGAQVGAVIAETKSGGAAAVTGFDWITRAYNIAADSDKLVLTLNETDYYVDGTNGDDAAADGSAGKPFKTMVALMGTIPRGADVAVRVIVKDETPVNQSILINNFKKLTIEGWAGASAGQEPKLIRVAGFTDYMLQAPAGKEIVIKDITLDGGKVNQAESLVYVSGGTFTQIDSTITNNYAVTDGGGVFLSDGIYNIDGGKVTGNKVTQTGVNGSDVNYFGGEMHITGGSPVIGTGTLSGNPGGTIYDGLYLNTGKYIYLDKNLTSPARIYFEKINGAFNDRVIVQKKKDSGLAPVNKTEKNLFIISDNSYGTRLIPGDETYVLNTVAYYVASPGGAYQGSDSNSGSEQFPFATLKKALDTATANTEADIYIMDNVELPAGTSTLNSTALKTINIKPWEDAASDVKLTRAADNTSTLVTVTGTYTLNVEDVIFDGANVTGAGSFFSTAGSSKLNLKNVILRNNTGILPAINVAGSSTITMTDGGIYDCTNTTNGGGVSMASGTFTISGSAINGNNSAGAGGAVNLTNGTLTLTNATVTNNIAGGSGGAINQANGTLTLTNSIVTNNTADGSGGAINKTNGTLNANSSTITGNGSVASGGAINTANGALNLTDTTIDANTATSGYPGIYHTAGTINVGGNVKIGNTISDTNGIYFGGTVSVAITMTKSLAETANINIHSIPDAYSAKVVVNKAAAVGATSPEEAVLMHYVPGPFAIVKNLKVATQYILSNITAWYVASEDGEFSGSDVEGEGLGTKDAPFATLARAVAVSSVANATTSTVEPTNIYVMDDLVISKTAALVSVGNVAPAGQRDIIVSGVDGKNDAKKNHTITRNSAFIGSFFNLGIGTKLTLGTVDGATDGLILDGNNIDNAQPVIFMTNPGSNGNASTALTTYGTEIKNNISTSGTAGSGGAVYMQSGTSANSTFTMNGGEITGNIAPNGGGINFQSGRLYINDGSVIKGNNATAENGVGNNPGSTIGNDIYINSGSAFQVTGLVKIGTKDTPVNGGDGIYFNTAQGITAGDGKTADGNLKVGTDIVIEFRQTSNHNDTIVTNNAYPAATAKDVNNEGMFTYVPKVYDIKYNGAGLSDKNYHLVATRSTYYVSQSPDAVTLGEATQLGDDILGDGSVEKPLYTVPLAFRAVQPTNREADFFSHVIVKDDITLNAQAQKVATKGITIEGWEGYSGSEDFPVVLRAGTGYMFNVSLEASAAAEANRLIMKNLILDGAGVNETIVNIGTTNNNTMSAVFEMQSGEIRKYVAQAVMVNGGTGTYNNIGIFRMLGGKIGGVKSTIGYAVRLNATYPTTVTDATPRKAMLEIAGSPVLGIKPSDGGVYLGSDNVPGKIIVLNGTGALDNLKADASINFHDPNMLGNTLIVKDITETDDEAAYFHSNIFKLVPTVTDGGGELGYIAKSAVTDLYVASPDGDFHGSDEDGDGSKEFPFETVAFAVNTIPTDLIPHHIYVMDDVWLGAETTISNGKNIFIESVSLYPDGSDKLKPIPGMEKDSHTVKTETGVSSGIFTVQNNSVLSIKNLTIDGSGYKRIGTSAKSAIYVVASAGNQPVLNLNEGFTLKNYHTEAMGVIRIVGASSTAKATLNMDGAIIRDNASYSKTDGGGISVASYGVLDMNNSQLINNTEWQDNRPKGGGIFSAAASEVTITGNSVLDANKVISVYTGDSYACGGNIYVGGNVSISGDTVIKNGQSLAYSSYEYNCFNYGGNIYIPSGGVFNMTGGAIQGGRTLYSGYYGVGSGSTNEHGGGIYVTNGSANLNGVTITGNYGHGIMGSTDSKFSMTDCTVQDNLQNGFPGYNSYDIFFSGTGLEVGGKMLIGKNRTSGGVYLNSTSTVIKIASNLDEDSKIFVKYKTPPADGTIIAERQEIEGSLVEADEDEFIWMAAGAKIVQDEENEKNLILKLIPIYVSEIEGDDDNFGTEKYPYKSFAFVSTICSDYPLPTDIYVIDDITVNAPIAIASKTLNFHKYTEDSAEGDEPLWPVADEVKIKRGTGSGNVMYVSGTSVMNIGRLTLDGNRDSGRNASILNVGGGTVNLNGTKIAGNYSADGNSVDGNNRYGSGVGVYMTGGTVNMNEGSEISNNSSPIYWGGGVYLYGAATFNLNDGSIHDNTAMYGAGVFVDIGTFNMIGGQISDNTISTAGGHGGGIDIYHQNNARVDISGGIITGNTTKAANKGEAIYFAGGNGKLILSGNPIIGYDNTDNGIYINGATTITQKDDFAAGAVIVLEGKTGAAANTIVADKTGGRRASLLESGYFIWQNGQYKVIPSGADHYKLVTLVEYYVSGQDGIDSDIITGKQSQPFATIEYALSQCPAMGSDNEPVYAVIYIMDDQGGLDTANGLTIAEGQNITIQRWAAATQRSINVYRGTGAAGPMFNIEKNASLLISDLNINGGGAEIAGPIVYTEGLFMLTSGSLQNNNSVGAGAVELSGAAAEFDLDGGLLINNTSKTGAGAVNIGGGIFQMQAGVISDNDSASGYGAVTIGKGSAFNMQGGQITGNPVKDSYAVLFDSEDSSMSVGGTARIGANKMDNGVYLGKDNIISLTSDMSSYNRINVAGKDDYTRGTVIVEKTIDTDIEVVNDTEARQFYWQPRDYSVKKKTDTNQYILGNVEANFITAIPDGLSAITTTTKITLEFDAKLTDLTLDDITLDYDEEAYIITKQAITFDREEDVYEDLYEHSMHYFYDFYITGTWDNEAPLPKITVHSDKFELVPEFKEDLVLFRDITDYYITFDANGEGATVEGEITTSRLIPDIGMSVTDAAIDPRCADITTGMPGDAVRDGYRFEGWSLIDSGTGGITNTAIEPGTEFTEATAIEGDIRVYAIWYKYKTFTVNFDGNDADDKTWSDERAVTEPGTHMDNLPAPPVKTGYTFTGWNTKPDGTGSIVDTGTDITGDVTVYAQWKKDPDQVTTPPAIVTTPPAIVTTPPAIVTTPPAIVTTPPAIDTTPPTQKDAKVPSDSKKSKTPPPPESEDIPAPDAVGTPVTAGAVTGGAVTDVGDPTDAVAVVTRQPGDGPDRGVLPGDADVGGTSAVKAGGLRALIDQILNGEVPLFGGDGMWALLNLLLAAIGCALAVCTLITRIIARRKKSGEEADRAGREEPGYRRGHIAWLAVLILLGICGIVLFVLTEDMTQLMSLMDKWTIWQAAITLLAIIITRTVLHKKKDRHSEQSETASPIQ